MAVAWIVPAVLAALLGSSFAVVTAGPRPSPKAGAGIASSQISTAAAPIHVGPVSAHVDASPFFPDGDGARDTTNLVLTLDAAAHVDVSVADFDGLVVRQLAVDVARAAGPWSLTWDGTTAAGAIVADGPYRFDVAVRSDAGDAQVQLWVTKSKLSAYPAAPGAVVVVLDSGHGGPDPGAVYGGKHEADYNLDIASRLQHMLEAAGVTVVMTRTENRAVNDPPVDVSGDGKITHGDELIIRNDIANLARADLHVVLMNNAYGCHCVQGTETYTSDTRSWTAEGVDLARFTQAAHMKRLKAFKSKKWRPTNRGVRFYNFAALRPYHVKVMPRPSLMPSILVESLFMDHKNELAVLSKTKARAALASSYYDGIVQWLAKRPYGLRYDVLEATSEALKGTTADYRMRLTNRGNTTSSGWVLEARQASTAGPYDATPTRGLRLATTPVPDGLAPGHSVDVVFQVPLPTVAGNWRFKFDVALPSGETLGDHGVVGPQLAVTTTDPVIPTPTPEPTPVSTPEPTAVPTPEPTPVPTPEPTPEPTAVPTSEPTPVLTPEPTAEPTPQPTPEPTPLVTPDATEDPTFDPGIEPSPGSVGIAGEPGTIGGGGYWGPESRLLSPSIFSVTLPPDTVRPVGLSAPVHYRGFQPWRRYTVPIDIPLDSARGQHGLDDHQH
jgi:N-acetylmuramoyl-L-alanine amidase